MDKEILWRNGAVGRKFIASYSGGKDSTLALYITMKQGEAVALIVMMEEKGIFSRSHRLNDDIIKAQAESIGLPVLTAATSWDDYEDKFIELLNISKTMGADVLVAGDLDVPDVDCWHDKVTKKVDMSLSLPLKEMNHRQVVTQFVDSGFISIIVTVNLSKGMKKEDLGRKLTKEYIIELENRGIDSCGENGEFHTIVVDGPIFKNKIDIVFGKIITQDEYAFLDCRLK